MGLGRFASLLLLVAASAGTGCGDISRDTPGDGGAERSDGTPAPEELPQRLSVATWNVHGLYDEIDDPTPHDPVLTPEEVEAKLEAIAAVLRQLNADVVVLQEVEKERLLRRLLDGPLAGRGYTELGLEDGSDSSGIDVGFIARVPVERVVSHLGEWFPNADGSAEYTFARDALELFIPAAGGTVVVMTLHLRSMRGGEDAQDHRIAEAMYARKLVERRMEVNTDRVLVAGDLNATPDSPTLDVFLEGGTLSDLTRNVPSEERWTFVFDDVRQQLDYVLATAPMAASLRSDGGVRIYHGRAIDAASDHAPVVAEFELDP